MGRPSKFKKAYCKELIAHMSEGLSFESFAGAIGVNRDTLYEWAEKHPEFSEAKAQGWAASMLWWEKIGRTGVVGKIKGFSATGWIFTMKCRFKWRDGSEQAQNTGGKKFTLAYADPRAKVEAKEPKGE